MLSIFILGIPNLEWVPESVAWVAAGRPVGGFSYGGAAPTLAKAKLALLEYISSLLGGDFSPTPTQTAAHGFMVMRYQRPRPSTARVSGGF